MLKRGLLLLICCGLAPMAGAAPAATYTNPVIPDESLADPTVMFHEGTYYLYPTGGVYRGYSVYTSKDLVHWTKGPQVFDSGRPNTWAPDVSYNPEDRKFYLYYTADWKIGVAAADRPEGPFADKGLLVAGAIDAHLFRDDDGKRYLYYTVGCTRMCVQPMASPTEKKGNPVELFRPAPGTWETRNGSINEGPWMIKHAGKYYLLYSGSGADTPDYAVGYAVAASPLGPFEKAAGNPIVQRGPGLFGPGHGCAVKDGAGKWWFVYHQKKNDGRNYLRDVCIDPLWFDAEGNLHGKATRGTAEPAPAPAGPRTPPR
jgi:beta-xylosidase